MLKAKAAYHVKIDADERRMCEEKGLDTQVPLLSTMNGDY